MGKLKQNSGKLRTVPLCGFSESAWFYQDTIMFVNSSQVCSVMETPGEVKDGFREKSSALFRVALSNGESFFTDRIGMLILSE